MVWLFWLLQVLTLIFAALQTSGLISLKIAHSLMFSLSLSLSTAHMLCGSSSRGQPLSTLCLAGLAFAQVEEGVCLSVCVLVCVHSCVEVCEREKERRALCQLYYMLF